MAWSLALVALALLGVAAVSRRLTGTPVTAAMVFVAFGLLVGPKVLDGIDVSGASATVRTLAETTLALVLFADASRIDVRALRRQVGVPERLLLVGLPLTIVAGAAAAGVLFGALTIWEAVILGVILAPTDAALGQAVVTEPRVPELQRLTRAMNTMVARLKIIFEAQAQQVEGLRREALSDPATGLSNRKHFMAQLAGMLHGEDGGAWPL